MYRQNGMTIGGDTRDAERVQGLIVTPSFFQVLRVEAFRGRVFTEEEAEVGKDQKVLLTHGFWQRQFGGADGALGQSLRVNGVPMTIIGVLSPAFRFVDPDIQIVRPVAFTPEDRADDRRHSNSWQQVGRLKPGATIDQVTSQLNAVNTANDERFPQLREVLRNAGFTTKAVGFQEYLVGNISPDADPPVGRRAGGADYRLRERDQSRAGAIHGPDAGARHPPRARRQHEPPGASELHREHAGGRHRWGRGAGPGLVGPGVRAAPWRGPAAARQRHRHRRAGRRLHACPHRGRRRGDGGAAGRGPARHESRADRARGRALGHRRSWCAAGAPRIGHEPGRVCADAADWRRGDGRQPPARSRRRPGLPWGSRADRVDLAAHRSLRRRRRAAERDRPAARTGAGDSRCRGRRAVVHHPVLRQQQRQRDPGGGLPDGPWRVGRLAEPGVGHAMATSRRWARAW